MQQFQTIKWFGLIVVDRYSNCVMCCVVATTIDSPLSPSDASLYIAVLLSTVNILFLAICWSCVNSCRHCTKLPT